MYLPELFREDDRERLFEIIRRYSFGTLVTAEGEAPFASHLPFVLDGERGERGTLYAHVARANPHWRALSPEREVLAVFQGPHAYVSPSWYEEPLNVPTWNYVAVHAYGQPSLLDRAGLLRLLARLVDENEARFATPWRMESLPRDFLDELCADIVGFEIPIARLEGKLKLSQNRSDTDRARVRATFSASDDPAERAVAAWMERLARGPEGR